jgi:hypothetical protein
LLYKIPKTLKKQQTAETSTGYKANEGKEKNRSKVPLRAK